MTLSRFVFLASLLITLVTADSAVAQFRSDMMAAPPPSVLSPAPSKWWIGPQLGANLNTHSGDFITEFCDCGFEDGAGAGFTIGVEAGHYLSDALAVAVKVVYNDLRADYSYGILEDADLLEDNGELVTVEDVMFERNNTVVISYFMINPVLQLYPLPWLYMFAGPAIGANTTATQEYTKLVTDERFLFELGDPESRLIEEDSGELKNPESIRADLRIGLGANVRLGRGFLFSPEISYGYPLTTISDDDNWTASAIHLIGVFKFEL